MIRGGDGEVSLILRPLKPRVLPRNDRWNLALKITKAEEPCCGTGVTKKERDAYYNTSKAIIPYQKNSYG